MAVYRILSLKWSRKGEPLTWWRANDRGYCWREDWMGTYTADEIASAPGYYDNGEATLAVPVEIVARYVRDSTPDEWRFESPRLVPRSALPKIRAALRRRAAKAKIDAS